MRLYTGKGDHGTTDLLGARVAKDDAAIDALGALDEASAAMGVARAQATSDRTRQTLIIAQRDLYQIMAEMAFTPELRSEQRRFAAERVIWLESETDALTEAVELPPHFVLPGETLPGAVLDVARTVTRRAERATVTVAGTGHIDNEDILRYLNRLSSLLFILARYEDALAGAGPRLAKSDYD